MLRAVKRRELIRRFRRLGFEGPFEGSRHAFMVKGSLKIHIPNPHRQDVGIPLLREILRQAGIGPESWR